MLQRTDYLTKRYGLERGWTLDAYERDGGYNQARRALRMKREDIVDEVKAAMIERGRKKGWGETLEEVAPHAAASFLGNSTGIVGEPEDVGNLLAFLASDRARYIHGANLRIDGGAADHTQ